MHKLDAACACLYTCSESIYLTGCDVSAGLMPSCEKWTLASPPLTRSLSTVLTPISMAGFRGRTNSAPPTGFDPAFVSEQQGIVCALRKNALELVCGNVSDRHLPGFMLPVCQL